jgi:glycosyltransferase involved in cell wall biosynthesis
LHAPDHLVESLKKTYTPFLAKLRFVLGSIRRFKFDPGYWRKYDKQKDPDYQFIQLADFIKAPSQSMKQWVVNNWDIEAGHIHVIPNIFSPSEALLNIPISEVCNFKYIVFFGRLNVLKGLVNATRAMKKILKQYPEWQFRVIGDDGPGPYHDAGMKAWMQEKLNGVIGRVTFINGLDYEELPKVIADSEIVLLPSLFESFSYACAEAMAAGKAVVGSKNGGMADLIKDGENGLLVDPDKEKDIFEAVKKLIENNSTRYQYSLKARQRILQDYNAIDTAKLYDRYYKKIAGY